MDYTLTSPYKDKEGFENVELDIPYKVFKKLKGFSIHRDVVVNMLVLIELYPDDYELVKILLGIDDE